MKEEQIRTTEYLRADMNVILKVDCDQTTRDAKLKEFFEELIVIGEKALPLLEELSNKRDYQAMNCVIDIYNSDKSNKNAEETLYRVVKYEDGHIMFGDEGRSFWDKVSTVLPKEKLEQLVL